MKMQQRIALVTGGNKGIGFEVVRQLARKGFHVFLGARNEEAGKAAVRKLNREAEEEGSAENTRRGAVTALKIDVSKPDSIRSAAEEFSRKSDRLDTLVNNAGILLDGDKDVLTITPEIFETTLRTNTLGALLVSGVRSVPEKQRRAAHRECLQRRRPIDRWRRWLGACVLHFEDGAQRRHRTARRRVTEVRDKFGVSGLGPHRHGRL